MVVIAHSAVALVAAVLAIASSANANLVKDEAELPKEYLSLAPGYAVPENQSEFGRDIFEGEYPNPMNQNPLNHINLFRRQEGAKCTFYRSGDARTCITADNKCCIDPNNAQDGWCCAPTAGCGPGTGTLGKCTTNIAWSTSYVYTTSTTTRYSTLSTSIATSTETTTRLWTEVEVVTRSDVETATVWVTETITAVAAKAKRTAAPTSSVPVHSDAAPVQTTSVPSATPTVEQQQVELRAAVTNAPRVFVIEGKLYKRQVLRTDTSVTTSTSTAYVTDTIVVTSAVDYVATSTSYSTTTTTRTSALNARTTVTETLTQTVQPGETVPINPVSPAETGPGGGGGGEGGGGGTGGGRRGGSSGGLSTGAKAGIGGGVGAGILAIIAVVGICFMRRRKKTATPTNPSTFAPGGGPAMAGVGAANVPPSTLSSPAPTHPAAGHYGHESKGPHSNAAGISPGNSIPPNSPPPPTDRYSHMSQTPMGVGVGGYPNSNATHSPSPQYSYQNQQPQGSYSEMAATPVSYNAQPQPSTSPQGGYAYPRPASPGSPPPAQNYGYGQPQGGYGGQSYASHGGQPQEIYSQYQAPPQEMPTGDHAQTQGQGVPKAGYGGPGGER